MLLSALPAPTREYGSSHVDATPKQAAAPARIVKEPPPYGSVERARFVPRKQEDFGDGGAFPEIHVAQFPLDMGNKAKEAKTGSTLALTVNKDGDINYDALIRQGKNRDKLIAADHGALVPKIADESILERPDEEEVDRVTRETAAALNLVVSNKIQAAQPKTLPKQPGEATFIKYTPAQQGPQYNSGAGQRIIKMQDMPVDPMEPPKFRHKKVPRGGGSPPVPVMHSPPRPVSVRDQQDWKIPPCISNWKNPKGYTIPLDKRLAADGRGLQEVAINDKFAAFAESLYVAEQTSRQAVEARNRVQREAAAREKEAKERELRELAMRARMDRTGAGGAPPTAASRSAGAAVGGAAEYNGTGAGYREPTGGYPGPPPVGGDGNGALPGPPPRESKEEREERLRREEIRRERQRERERERRLDAKEAHGSKKSKLTRDRDRDVSEKIALGMANVGGGEAMYDQRLFNQDTGMASGFGGEDTYNMYDKPLFTDRGSNLYKPKAAVDDELYGGGAGAGDAPSTEKFKPDKGFKGVDYATKGAASGGPVQFERDAAEADPFGLDQFLTDVKGTTRGNTLDKIGGGGAMRAGGGGGKYEDYAGGSSRSRVDFAKGGA